MPYFDTLTSLTPLRSTRSLRPVSTFFLDFSRPNQPSASSTETSTIFFLVLAPKLAVLETALASGDAHRHPVAAVMNAPPTPAHVHWSP